MAVAALVAVSAAVSAYGAYRQAEAAKNAAEYEGDVAEQNAKIQERNAQDVEARGRDEQDRYKRRLAQMMGSQRVQLAGTGVDIGGGSALDLMADTAGEGARDVFTMGQNTARDAYGVRIGAMSSMQQASMSRATAAGISPWLAAGTSALNSASGAAQSGMFDGKDPGGGGGGGGGGGVPPGPGAGSPGGAPTLMSGSSQFNSRWNTFDRMQRGRGV
jgi:hypothetical protein